LEADSKVEKQRIRRMRRKRQEKTAVANRVFMKLSAKLAFLLGRENVRHSGLDQSHHERSQLGGKAYHEYGRDKTKHHIISYIYLN
jgi:hypothetical protein